MATTLTISSGSLVVDGLTPWSAIQSITAGTSGSPTVATRDGPWTIVLVSGVGSPTEFRVKLPTDSQLNDLIELQVAPGAGSLAVQASSVESINGAAAVNLPVVLRKVTSSAWLTP